MSMSGRAIARNDGWLSAARCRGRVSGWGMVAAFMRATIEEGAVKLL